MIDIRKNWALFYNDYQIPSIEMIFENKGLAMEYKKRVKYGDDTGHEFLPLSSVLRFLDSVDMKPIKKIPSKIRWRRSVFVVIPKSEYYHLFFGVSTIGNFAYYRQRGAFSYLYKYDSGYAIASYDWFNEPAEDRSSAMCLSIFKKIINNKIKAEDVIQYYASLYDSNKKFVGEKIFHTVKKDKDSLIKELGLIPHTDVLGTTYKLFKEVEKSMKK